MLEYNNQNMTKRFPARRSIKPLPEDGSCFPLFSRHDKSQDKIEAEASFLKTWPLNRNGGALPPPAPTWPTMVVHMNIPCDGSSSNSYKNRPQDPKTGVRRTDIQIWDPAADAKAKVASAKAKAEQAERQKAARQEEEVRKAEDRRGMKGFAAAAAAAGITVSAAPVSLQRRWMEHLYRNRSNSEQPASFFVDVPGDLRCRWLAHIAAGRRKRRNSEPAVLTDEMRERQRACLARFLEDEKWGILPSWLLLELNFG